MFIHEVDENCWVHIGEGYTTLTLRLDGTNVLHTTLPDKVQFLGEALIGAAKSMRNDSTPNRSPETPCEWRFDNKTIQ